VPDTPSSRSRDRVLEFDELLERVTGDPMEKIQGKWEDWIKRRYYQQYLEATQKYSDYRDVDAARFYPDVFAIAPDGGQVRVGDVADVRMVSSPTVIKRKDVSEAIDIGLDVDGRSTGAVADDVRHVLRTRSFPLEYHAELLNAYSERRSNHLTFLALCGAGMLGIFLVLQAALRSWLLASLALVLVPGALAGGVVAILVDGNLVTLGSLMGFLAVFALAARHSVALLNRCQELKHDAGDAMSPDIVRRALRERIAPFAMTVVAAALVFLPFVVMGDVAGTEVVEPMAAVILGGLVTTIVVCLAVVPAIFLRFGSRRGEDPDMFADLASTGFDDEIGPDAGNVPATVG